MAQIERMRDGGEDGGGAFPVRSSVRAARIGPMGPIAEVQQEAGDMPAAANPQPVSSDALDSPE